jgi:uncharacterized protein
VLIHHAGGHGFGVHLIFITLLHEFGSVLTALGYVGTVCLLVYGGVLGFLGKGLASVGRMSLSNYLAQSVSTTFIMYWWGLAWFGDVSRPQQVGLVCAVFTGQMIISTMWLRFFTMGPMEWLWRSATYLRLQPIRRTAST